MKHPPSSRRFFLSLLPWVSVFFIGVRFLAAQTPPACQQTKILLSDGILLDFAGNDVELNDDFLFVGKSTFNFEVINIPGVYIFQPGLTPNTWVEIQVILNPLNNGQSSLFGSHLELSNDRLIVLAANDDGATNNSGAAYIFHFDVVANTWAFEAKLFASDGNISEGRGDVSISFDLAIIGSEFHTHGGIDSGAAHIFGFDGTFWNEEAELLAGDRSAGDDFGNSVAIVGNVVIIGAPNDDDLGTNSGSVYVFKKFTGSWIQVGKITAPDGAAGDDFGGSLDFDGTTLAIGALRHDYGGPDLGAVYLFQDNGLPGWEFITKLTPPTNGDGLNDHFGRSVDIDGDRLAIGASLNADDGSAHVYRDSGTGWEHVLRIVAQDTLFGEGFGGSIAIHNETVAIGAPWDFQLGEEAGAVYTHTDIFTPDCNANCISDTEEIAADPALDCNLNGILDECDLTDGVTLDCNLNGIPDECEDCDNNGIADECDLNPRYSQGSGSLSPIGLGSDANFTFVAPPTRLSDVTFDFTASADLASIFVSIDVFLNGVNIGEIFKTTGTNCADPPDEDQIILTQASFDAIVGSGDAD
ncbi:MAG: FG-GAP repeat protein, partial [Planctomycetes bacterium]|nr:FG-GAP repeat protein [Planctomycetota bacterium]